METNSNINLSQGRIPSIVRTRSYIQRSCLLSLREFQCCHSGNSIPDESRIQQNDEDLTSPKKINCLFSEFFFSQHTKSITSKNSAEEGEGNSRCGKHTSSSDSLMKYERKRSWNSIKSKSRN